ncbi:MAG: hypothetical protein JW732_09975 [Dehalococcoidia bacterium]|nr:hypothetical protein [Dehalococcoidia bacterium]
MLRRIGIELARHAPFTAAGAVSGIVIMAIVVLVKTPSNVSETIFYILHPAHVLFSAIVTTAMYKRYSTGKLWAAILIGYTGSVGISTLSDSIIPYLGGESLSINMEFHIGFIEKWWLVNPLAFLGIAIGYLRPTTKLPHAAHVFLSTWASLFYFTAFGAAQWLPLLPLIFLFLFLAVWIPCCVSDIVYPHLFLGGAQHHHD